MRAKNIFIDLLQTLMEKPPTETNGMLLCEIFCDQKFQDLARKKLNG